MYLEGIEPAVPPFLPLQDQSTAPCLVAKTVPVKVKLVLAAAPNPLSVLATTVMTLAATVTDVTYLDEMDAAAANPALTFAVGHLLLDSRYSVAAVLAPAARLTPSETRARML